MERVLQVVVDYQWWLYGLLGLVLLFYLRRAFLARRESARSIFKLEQEQARSRYGHSVILMAVVLVVMAAVFGLTNFLIPTLDRPPEPTPSATSGPLTAPTLTPTPLPPTITPTATATKVLPTRPALTTTPQVVASATPVVRPPSCPDPNVRLISPGMNQVVRGMVPIRGTANHAQFQYYKIEFGPGSSPDTWTVVGELHYNPVVTGLLETFNSEACPPGPCSLRLVVVDKTGNFPDPCQVTVTVQR